MCGIAGIVGDFGDGYGRVQCMIDALLHRGPDDQGVFEADGAVLGQRRLAIIDLASGHQPMVDAATGLSITFNGEIYNYRELRDELLAKGVRFETNSDTEVILKLFHLHGPKVVEYLRGMFAFAIWDEKQQQLFAARDHLGQKPFYYNVCDRSFAFASEIKGLFSFDPSLRELDYEALDQYFSVRVIASPYSMFRKVRKLPPAHYLTFSLKSGLRIERYWNLDFEPKISIDENELIDELEARLIETVRLHMVSDVPVGAFMSGGLDSTLVTAILMKHVAQSEVPTFTLGFPHQQYNEAPLARLVAEKYGTKHFERIEVPSLIQHLPDVVYHLDEPSDPLSICTYMIAQTARQHVKVVLGGDGGDELFGGYDRYYGNVYAGYYARLPKWLRTALIGPILMHLPDGAWYKSKGHQLKWLHRLSFSQGGERYAKSLSYFYFAEKAKRDLYGPTLTEKVRDFDAEHLIAQAYEAASAQHPVDHMLYADNCIRLPDHPVMISDRMTMAHGLEARSPFMDHRLVEFMAKVPVQFKVRGRKLRYLQRQIARRYLPDELLSFRKQGFSSPLPYLLKDQYAQLFRAFLARPELGEAGLVNPGHVGGLLDQHLNRGADHGNRLWLLLNAEIWYRMNFCGATREDIRSMASEDTNSPSV